MTVICSLDHVTTAEAINGINSGITLAPSEALPLKHIVTVPSIDIAFHQESPFKRNSEILRQTY